MRNLDNKQLKKWKSKNNGGPASPHSVDRVFIIAFQLVFHCGQQQQTDETNKLSYFFCYWTQNSDILDRLVLYFVEFIHPNFFRAFICLLDSYDHLPVCILKQFAFIFGLISMLGKATVIQVTQGIIIFFLIPLVSYKNRCCWSVDPHLSQQ